MHFYKKSFDRKKYENLKIPYKIEPFDDELLSSYLIRVAYTFYCSPTSFYYLYFPEYFKNKVIFRRDMDIWADENFITKLSEKTRTSYEKLWNTTLRSYTGYLFENCRENTTNFMIDSLGIRGSLCKGRGYKFCPLCIRENNIPYLKKIWRVSFYTVCTKHNVLLLDKCPQCGESINPFKLSKDEILFACYRCGFNFRQSPVVKIPENSCGIKAVKIMEDVLQKGYFSWSSDNYVYSIGFFMVIRQLIKVLKILVRKEIVSESEILRHEILYDTEYFQKVKNVIFQKREIEKSGVLEKYFLFSAALNLLEDYPHRLKEFLNKHSICYSLLIRDFKNEKELPYFYMSVIDSFKNYSRAMNLEEFKYALQFLEKRGYASTCVNLEKVFGIKYKPKRNSRNYIFYKSILSGK
ncbi:MAG: TniQ family protein [Candidatus Aenigmatarchaeota archaeon]